MEKPFAPSLTDHEASESISKLGIKKTNSRPWQLLLLGVLAGLYIGFGGHLFLVTLQNGMGKVAGGAMFSVGLILVVVAGAELFTGNVTILIGVISNVISFRKMLSNWTFVYLGNLIGSVAFSWLMYHTGLLGRAGELNELGTLAASVADYKLTIPFMEAVLRGVFCNILVILAIIMAVIAKDVTSKILCIVFPITCFVACGFEHCVANMYLIPLGLLAKGVPLYQTGSMFQNLIPVTIGNVIGGVFILTIHPNRIRQIMVLLKRGQGKSKS
jgi:formate/nitrite transporter